VSIALGKRDSSNKTAGKNVVVTGPAYTSATQMELCYKHILFAAQALGVSCDVPNMADSVTWTNRYQVLPRDSSNR
jgi:hypothetical protein